MIKAKGRLLLYYLKQLLPPATMLLLLMVSGPGLWFFLAIPLLASIYSAIGGCLFVLLNARKIRKERKSNALLLRPALTIFFGAIVMITAVTSYNEAKFQAREIAQTIHEICNRKGKCPETLPYQSLGMRESDNEDKLRSNVGTMKTYPIFYSKDGESFELFLYRVGGTGHTYRGGPDEDLVVR